jgi:hypothetical protein
MKQILIQLDEAMAAQLEKIAPGSSRKRSEFLRGVIARAIHETLELRTREAYKKWPDQRPPVEPADWADETEAVHPSAKRKRANPSRRRKA